MTVNVLQKVVLKQSGPSIELANRKYLPGSSEPGFPRTLKYASDDDCDCYQLQTQETLATVGENIKSIVSKVNPRGATLFRGLDQIVEDNSSFGELVDMIGDKFAYTAGMATRREFADAPG